MAAPAAVSVGATFALAALDAILGHNAQLSGSYMIGAFVAAILADVEVTVGVALLALALSILSPLWNNNFGNSDYFIKLGIIVAGDLFAIEMARLRVGSQRALRRQEALLAISELPAPGATLRQTVTRVTQVLVPRVEEFAAIAARRGHELVRVGDRGDEPVDPHLSETVTLRARGRDIGALTVGGSAFDESDREFLRVLGGRVALALDNAGLSEELETADQRLNAILANLGEAVTVQDASGRLVFANQAAADLLGAESVDQLLTGDPREVFDRFEVLHEDGTAVTLDELPGRRVLAGKPTSRLLVRAVDRVTGEERWRVTKATAVEGTDGSVALAVNVIEDVTDAKRAEFAQRLLSEASALLASSLDYERTLQRVAELAVPELADWCSVSLLRDGQLIPVAVANADPARVDQELIDAVTEAMQAQGSAGRERRAVVRELRTRSAMLVPLDTPERSVGMLALVSAESRPRFSPADLALAEELGRRAGTALENARLHTELGDVARTLQQSLLPPELPDVPGWSLRSLYLPASGEAEVGGDFYDVFPTAAGWMAVIGDVVGRGAAAASLTSMARYTLRTAGTLAGTPTMGFARLNENLRERGEMALCSAAVVLLRADAEASVVCAGHPLPLLVRAGRAEPVGRFGPLLGVFDHGDWLPADVQLESGDILVLYTDGVLDARSANGRGRFGEARLAETLAGVRDADEAVERIAAALDEFSSGEHTDDTAVLALMRT